VDHREALADLVRSGWVVAGVGDWAVALRSPDGSSVARVCPFDPAYDAFVELCRRCAGHPWLPRIERVTALDGGASVVVLEWLAPVPAAEAQEVLSRWEDNPVRVAAVAVDAEFRASTPWWDGIDLNPGNVRRSVDGRLTLIDIFCMDGAALYRQVLDDPADVRRRFPGRCDHLLDIPYLARETPPSELDALRAAWLEG
jgi:hypothetical protein